MITRNGESKARTRGGAEDELVQKRGSISCWIKRVGV